MLTDKEKIEILNRLIDHVGSMPVDYMIDSETRQQAQQWLAEIESGGYIGNEWIHAGYSLPEPNKIVEVLHSNFFEKKLFSTGYYSDNGTWYGSNKTGQLLFVKAWRPITPPKNEK